MTELLKQVHPRGAVEHSGEPLLDIRGLRVDFPDVPGAPAIDGMDLTVERGEIVALVGESGSGKSLTALTVMGLLPPGAEVAAGEARLEGEDVLAMSSGRRNQVRGSRVAMLFQQPKVMLDPTARVGSQVAESLRVHRKVGRREAKRRVVEMLRDVGIPEPARRASSFAYQLSGGMAQRVMIAAALSADPELLIADEPTTALDVTIQAQILDLMRDLKRTSDAAIILITHDLGVVAEVCDEVAVMYAGEIVERAPADRLFEAPQHPYTVGLLASIPRLDLRADRLAVIDGVLPDMASPPVGCRFADRCPFVLEECRAAPPPMVELGGRWSRCLRAPLERLAA